MNATTAIRHPRARFGRSRVGVLASKWSALQAAADAVASIAGVAAQPVPLPVCEGEERRLLVEQGIDDLSAIAVPGLSALLAAMARGARPQAAARALLQEFHAARDALLVLAGAAPVHKRCVG